MNTDQRSSVEANRARLAHAVEELFSTRKLIIASNRGPVEYRWNETASSWEGKRGSGGVVTAIRSVNRFLDTVWVACAVTEGDRELAKEIKTSHAKFSNGIHR